MLRWQAHEQLARALGDPVNFAGSPPVITGGVRYSTDQRDRWLYRAMIDLQSEVLKQTAALPGVQKSAVLTGLFPNFRRQFSTAVITAISGTNDQVTLPERAAFIYSVQRHDPADTSIRPEVFSRGTHADVVNFQSARHAIRMDPRFTVLDVGGATVIDMYYDNAEATGVTTTRPTVLVNYLPYPIDPSGQASNAPLDFEEHFMASVISRATIFGKIEDGDPADSQVLSQILMK